MACDLCPTGSIRLTITHLINMNIRGLYIQYGTLTTERFLARKYKKILRQ